VTLTFLPVTAYDNSWNLAIWKKQAQLVALAGHFRILEDRREIIDPEGEEDHGEVINDGLSPPTCAAMNAQGRAGGLDTDSGASRQSIMAALFE
jgi:hypothetical protein